MSVLVASTHQKQQRPFPEYPNNPSLFAAKKGRSFWSFSLVLPRWDAIIADLQHSFLQ